MLAEPVPARRRGRRGHARPTPPPSPAPAPRRSRRSRRGPASPPLSAAGRSRRSAGSSRPTRRPWPAWSPGSSASPTPEALGEVQEIIDTCDFFLGEGRRLYGQTVPSEMPDKQLFTFRVPVGAVAVVTAGNFPVAVPSWYLVPALVPATPSSGSRPSTPPASAKALFELIQAARAARRRAEHRVRRRPGDLRRAGAGAARPARCDKIGFTGSTAVGARIGELAGRHLQMPCLELGRQEPDGRHARRRPRAGRGGSAVLRLRHRRAAVHLAGHGHRARVACTTSSWRVRGRGVGGRRR